MQKKPREFPQGFLRQVICRLEVKNLMSGAYFATDNSGQANQAGSQQAESAWFGSHDRVAASDPAKSAQLHDSCNGVSSRGEAGDNQIVTPSFSRGSAAERASEQQGIG